MFYDYIWDMLETELYPEKEEWFVTKENGGMTYYIYDIDKNNFVKWGLEKEKAKQWQSRNDVKHFVHKYLNNRNDIFIVSL